MPAGFAHLSKIRPRLTGSVTVRTLGSKIPRIAPTAWVSEAAYVVGDVELGEGSSVWPGPAQAAGSAEYGYGLMARRYKEAGL